MRELGSTLRNMLGSRIVRFILYGSKARGDYTSESDIDVAIVVADLTKELKNQIYEAIAGIELKHLTPISSLVLSQKDFNLLHLRERRIVSDIENEGVPL